MEEGKDGCRRTRMRVMLIGRDEDSEGTYEGVIRAEMRCEV